MQEGSAGPEGPGRGRGWNLSRLTFQLIGIMTAQLRVNCQWPRNSGQVTGLRSLQVCYRDSRPGVFLGARLGELNQIWLLVTGSLRLLVQISHRKLEATKRGLWVISRLRVGVTVTVAS